MVLIAQKHLRTQIRKEQIIEATEKIIRGSGSENVTVRQIAEEVGISEGAIYRHFESKAEIFSLLLNGIRDNLLSSLEGGLIPDGKIIDYLHNTFISQILTTNHRDAISLQIISEVISLGDKELNKQLKGIIDNYLTHIKNVLQLGVRTGEVRKDIDLDSTTMFFFSIIDSISRHSTLNNETFDLEGKSQAMWEIFKKAIANTSNVAD